MNNLFNTILFYLTLPVFLLLFCFVKDDVSSKYDEW